RSGLLVGAKLGPGQELERFRDTTAAPWAVRVLVVAGTDQAALDARCPGLCDDGPRIGHWSSGSVRRRLRRDETRDDALEDIRRGVDLGEQAITSLRVQGLLVAHEDPGSRAQPRGRLDHPSDGGRGSTPITGTDRRLHLTRPPFGQTVHGLTSPMERATTVPT